MGLLAYVYEGKSYDAGDKLGFLKATVEIGLENEEFGQDFRESGGDAKAVGRALQAAKKMTCCVIPSQAKNLSMFVTSKRVFRFAQNDSVLSFFSHLFSRSIVRSR